MSVYYARNAKGHLYSFGGAIAKDSAGRPVDKEGKVITLVPQQLAFKELYGQEFVNALEARKNRKVS